MNDETIHDETAEGGMTNTPAEAGTTNVRLDLRPALWASAAILAVMFGLSWWAWAKIPEGRKIPVHWNIRGKVDGYAGKTQELLMMPIIGAAIGSTALTFGIIVAGALALTAFSLVYSYLVWKSDPNKRAAGS
jgi:hypothetical protein